MTAARELGAVEGNGQRIAIRGVDVLDGEAVLEITWRRADRVLQSVRLTRGTAVALAVQLVVAAQRLPQGTPCA